MPDVSELPLAGAFVLEPQPVADERGWFARYFCVQEFESRRPGLNFVQFNHSYTRARGSIRGMHLQVGDAAEEKLVKCVRGAVLDVLVDVRRGSPTFLRHATVRLSEGAGNAVFIPKGVAHGFQTLQDDTELIYHHSNFYAPEAERGLRYDDPRLAIEWPLPPADISEKDRAWSWLDADFNGFGVQ